MYRRQEERRDRLQGEEEGDILQGHPPGGQDLGKNVSRAVPQADRDGRPGACLRALHALRKLGWKGSLKSIPACYLLGLLGRQEGEGEGRREAYLYNGRRAVRQGLADLGVREGGDRRGRGRPVLRRGDARPRRG